jgi:hypothetical protein
MDYATADTVVSRRPTSNTLSPLPVPTSFDSLSTGPTNVHDREAVCKSSSTPWLTTDPSKITNSIPKMSQTRSFYSPRSRTLAVRDTRETRDFAWRATA